MRHNALRPYFTYAAGDIIMCGYRSTDIRTSKLSRPSEVWSLFTR